MEYSSEPSSIHWRTSTSRTGSWQRRGTKLESVVSKQTQDIDLLMLNIGNSSRSLGVFHLFRGNRSDTTRPRVLFKVRTALKDNVVFAQMNFGTRAIDHNGSKTVTRARKVQQRLDD